MHRMIPLFCLCILITGCALSTPSLVVSQECKDKLGAIFLGETANQYAARTLQDTFGLSPNDYTLSHIECDPGLTSFIMIRGISKNQEAFTAFYLESGATSGGSWDVEIICIESADADVQARALETICPTLVATHTSDKNCAIDVINDTEAVRAECESGNYSKDGRISLRTQSFRWCSSVEALNKTCDEAFAPWR